MSCESNSVELSIVIGFRDWGLDRLTTAIHAHHSNVPAGIAYEIVVSDFGSQDKERVAGAVRSAGGRLVRSARVGPWSRSRALNIGVNRAKGRFVITTDADIVFSSTAYMEAVRLLRQNPYALYLIQCRDLPPAYDAHGLMAALNGPGAIDFSELHKSSTVRPRWGMGGFAAFSVQEFCNLNGYDERMTIWGKEDNDFADRFRRAQRPIRWLSGSGANIYHIWHEPSKQSAEECDEGRAAIENNTRILKDDPTIVRNLSRPSGALQAPVVSVVIATCNRSDTLREAVASCLRQTFPEFEVVVVEDSRSQGAKGVIEEFDDSRVRYAKSPRPGAAAARNVGTMIARGKYIAIHDDDDVMVTTRLEDHLGALTSYCHGTYGGWLDFDDASGRVIGVNPGKEFSFENLLFGSKVLIHPCTLIEKGVLRAFPYDETREAGIDYALFLRMAWAGLRMSHTTRFGLLRRMHESNMTSQRSSQQKAAADDMKRLMLSELSEDHVSEGRERARKAEVVSCMNGEVAREELVAARNDSNSDARVAADEMKRLLGSEWLNDDAIERVLDFVPQGFKMGCVRDHKKAYILSRARYLERRRNSPVSEVADGAGVDRKEKRE